MNYRLTQRLMCLVSSNSPDHLQRLEDRVSVFSCLPNVNFFQCNIMDNNYIIGIIIIILAIGQNIFQTFHLIRGH